MKNKVEYVDRLSNDSFLFQGRFYVMYGFRIFIFGVRGLMRVLIGKIYNYIFFIKYFIDLC